MENRQSRRKTKGKRESNFVVQGSILAVAGIIVGLIGILYRVPMTNIIGDEGMGYYSTAFNVYNIMLILSSTAFRWRYQDGIREGWRKGEVPECCPGAESGPLVYATRWWEELPALSPGILLISLQPQRLIRLLCLCAQNTGTHYLDYGLSGRAGEDSSRGMEP